MAHSKNREDTNFYYLVLLEEKSSYKDQNLIVINAKEYGIHGLWAQIDKNSYTRHCDTHAEFNEDSLIPIKRQLNEFWHSNQRTNESFWKHEWLKHGTCTNPQMNEFDYFSQVITLYKLVKNMYSNDQIEIQNYFNKKESMFLIPFDLKFNLLNPTK